MTTSFDGEAWLKKVGERRSKERRERQSVRTEIAAGIRARLESLTDSRGFVDGGDYDMGEVEGLRKALQMVVGTRE